MTSKIIGTKTLDDGQHIYLLGEIGAADLHDFCRPDDYIERNYSIEHRAHYGLHRVIRFTWPELATWLERNKVQATFWVDPVIFTLSPAGNYAKFMWGIGFKQDDPIEPFFILQWS